MHYFIFVFTEEGDHESLASPYLLYGQEEMDDMVDQSSIYSLDNGIQHTKQAGDTGENQVHRQMKVVQ